MTTARGDFVTLAEEEWLVVKQFVKPFSSGLVPPAVEFVSVRLSSFEPAMETGPPDRSNLTFLAVVRQTWTHRA